MLNGPYVELPAMLACREERANRQARLLEQYHCTIISFSLNIPGPVKTTPELRRLFGDGMQGILRVLSEEQLPLLERMERHEDTGDECLLAVRGEAGLIKKKMTALEEQHPLGRLFDIDVINQAGEKLSREHPRRCLICGEQAQFCARSRRHSVEELADRIEKLLAEFVTATNE